MSKLALSLQGIERIERIEERKEIAKLSGNFRLFVRTSILQNFPCLRQIRKDFPSWTMYNMLTSSFPTTANHQTKMHTRVGKSFWLMVLSTSGFLRDFSSRFLGFKRRERSLKRLGKHTLFDSFLIATLL